MKRFGVLAALVITATFVAGAGGGIAKTDLSTRAGVVQYLVQHGIDPTGVVIQRGARNYAGPSCPGRGWTCTHASRVVQISQGSANQFQCVASSGTPVVGPNSCTIVQFSSGARNDARCYERSVDPGVTQSCNVQQTNTTGDNRADVQQSVNVGDSPATDVSQFASVSQENGSGSNASQVQQSIQQSSSNPDGSGVQSQEGHQTADVAQDSATGDNRSDVNQSLAQKATTLAGTDNLTQNQNAQSFGPNTDASVDQTSTLGRNESHLNQSNDLAMRSNKVGAVNQTQGSFNGGLNGHVDQSSPGLSLSFASQNEKQKMDADKTASLSQTQFGPSFCCSVQQSNPQDQFSISQSSQQFADAGANQLNTVVGNCDSSGNCAVDQRIQQGNTTTNNSCSGPSCHTGLLCSEGGCSPCGVDDSSCPSPPSDCTECCEFSCDFAPGLQQAANVVLQRAPAVRPRR